VKVSKTKDINDAIKKQSRRSKSVKITGLNGQNYIAVGLNLDKQLSFEGSAGDFFGAMNNGSILTLKGKARRFIGDTMSKGGIILQGNAARGVGTAINGGIIVIRGNVSGDVGQLANGGTIIISGNAGSGTGAFMYNGEIIIAGNVGKDVGKFMFGGTIFVGGKIGSIGQNAESRDISENEKQKISKYFKHYGISKDVENFKKIIAKFKGKRSIIGDLFNSRFVTREPIPKSNIDEIKFKAKTGLMDLAGANIELFNKLKPSFPYFYDNLKILPSQTQPIKNWDDIDLNFDIGFSIGKSLKSPLVLEQPIYLESRAPGVVSTSTKMAFIYAASASNTPLSMGGPLLQEELDLLVKYKGPMIRQWKTNRFGVNIDYLKKSNAIELVLGRSGVGSLPNIIVNDKITKEISKLLNVPKGLDIILPPKLPDFDVPADMKRHVEFLKEITDYKIPIMIRIAAGNIYEDTKLALRAGADALVIDCIDNFRQDIPTITADNLGLHSIAAIQPAVRAIKDSRVEKGDFKLIVSGFFRNGADVFKALALGANGVMINTTAEIAIGCTMCGKCNLNTCPVGIGSTDPKLEIKLDWVEAGEKLNRFLNSMILELKLLMQLTGSKNIGAITKDMLRSVDYETASITGVKLAGYTSNLPMWDH
jgi:formylmethanofuran dehydrogenase subunit C